MLFFHKHTYPPYYSLPSFSFLSEIKMSILLSVHQNVSIDDTMANIDYIKDYLPETAKFEHVALVDQTTQIISVNGCSIDDLLDLKSVFEEQVPVEFEPCDDKVLNDIIQTLKSGESAAYITKVNIVDNTYNILTPIF